MKINSKHYHIFLNKGTWPLDWLIASRLWNSTPYITIWTIELQNYRSNTLIYVTDFSLNVLIPTLNSRLNLFIRFLSLSFHSKFDISVANRLQGRHSRQGPQGLGGSSGGTPLMLPPLWQPCLQKIGCGGPVLGLLSEEV